MNNRIKEAYLNGARNSLQKVAGISSELIGTLANPINTVVGLPSFVAGSLFGEEDKENIGDGAFMNLLMPAVGPYRLGNRLKAHLLED